jgi:hypothetical protein
VTAQARGQFLQFAYDWSHDGAGHEGVLLLGYDSEKGLATAAWVDSWHQSTRVMACTGSIDGNGTANLRGSYVAPPDADWGWRIVLTPVSGSELTMVMYNISPDGKEDLAVRAEYKRVSR